MKDLIFKNKGWEKGKLVIGALWIIYGIAKLVFLSDKPLTPQDWLTSIGFVFIGVIFFTPLVGNNETRIMVGEGNLKIKWITKIGEIIIRDNEIGKIILKNKKIEIQRKEKKAVVLPFEQWKLEDKTKVYQFMIEYARQKNLPLEK